GAGRGNVAMEEVVQPVADFLLGDVPKAMVSGETAVIGAGFVGTGLAFDVFSLRMDGNKPDGQLRAEERKGGNAEERREVARARVVANQRGGAAEVIQQFTDRGRRDNVGFADLSPPGSLVGVAQDPDVVVLGAQVGGDALVAFERPDAD